MKLFVNTKVQGGEVFAARSVVKPANKTLHEPTDMVICNPYRRVYVDESGLYVVWNKRKSPVYMVS
jgi:hypothetical protein